MKFYGTHDSIGKWKEIIETKLGVSCGKTIQEDSQNISSSFSVELTSGERDVLQDVYWYKVESDTTSPWNHRISFLD